MKETDIMRLIQVALSELGAVTFRNNVGLFHTSDGRVVKTGLCNGSSDLIGWIPDGRFLAVEVKRPGKKPSKEQDNFINAVNQAGGVGFWADSPDMALQKYKSQL